MLTYIYLAALAQASYTLASSQAASLLSSAHQLTAGNYYIENVGTGQRLVGDKTNLYPGSGKGVAVQVVPHTEGSARHTVMGMGTKGDRKCVSAAWSYSSGSDGTGSLYSCALGILAEGNPKSGLRTAKQAFILIPVSSNGKRDEIVERNEGKGLLEKRSRHQKHKHYKSTSHKKSSSKSHTSTSAAHHFSSSGSYGPYYIVATDHLTDQSPKAFGNEATTAMGQHVLKLVPLQKGNKDQEWLFIRA